MVIAMAAKGVGKRAGDGLLFRLNEPFIVRRQDRFGIVGVSRRANRRCLPSWRNGRSRTRAASNVGRQHLPRGASAIILACLLFKRKDIFKPVSVLNGGERVKTALAKLFLIDRNILLLDEPTNYLDLHTREWLEEVVRSYPVPSYSRLTTGASSTGRHPIYWP